jgi:hypothetical protein
MSEQYLPCDLRLIANIIERSWLDRNESCIDDLQVRVNLLHTLEIAKTLILNGDDLPTLEKQLRSQAEISI